MGNINKISLLLTALAGVGVYSGLDKLINLFMLLGIIALVSLFNGFVVFVNSPTAKFQQLLARFESPDKRRRIRFIFEVLAAVLAVAVCGAALFKLFYLASGAGFSVNDSLNRQVFYVIGSFVLFFFCLFVVRTRQETEKNGFEVQWYRSLCYFSLYHIAIFSLMLLNSFFLELELAVLSQIIDMSFFVGFVAMVLLLTELVIGLSGNTFALLRGKASAKQLPIPFFISCIASEESFKLSLISSLQTISGVNLASSEIVDFLVKIFEPVCIVSVIFIWLLSSIVIVPSDKEAIFARFGEISAKQAFGPGAYFKLPWPFSTVQLFDSFKIRTINVGFEPDPEQRNIIWTKNHAVTSFNLIVGDGVEIIGIDCQVIFKVNNLYQYITGLQNPEEFISATTYKLLTQETVGARFDDIITRDRRLFSEQIKTKLQAAIDEKSLGASIVEIVFLAMHPPLEVADAYEDVISAEIDKLTYELKANTENFYKLSMSTAEAKGKELEAESYAANLVANAIGDANSFASRTLGYEYAPALTRFRLRCEVMQRVLAGKKLYIIDKSLMRKEDRIFIDTRSQER